MLYAISDLHLSFYREKKMDKFGENWVDHTKKIEHNWRHVIKQDDTVLLCGDISWAMTMDEFMPDFSWLASLPGKKIISPGNHDFWWNSTSKLNALDSNVHFLKNNFIPYGESHICGAKGWVCPNDSEFTKHDEKIYKREAGRLRLSLDMAMQDGAKDIVVMMHFPPKNDKGEPSAFSEILTQYPVSLCIYGHLHGSAGFAKRNNPEDFFKLVSCDFIHFNPVLLRS